MKLDVYILVILLSAPALAAPPPDRPSERGRVQPAGERPDRSSRPQREIASLRRERDELAAMRDEKLASAGRFDLQASSGEGDGALAAQKAAAERGMAERLDRLVSEIEERVHVLEAATKQETRTGVQGALAATGVNPDDVEPPVAAGGAILHGAATPVNGVAQEEPR